MRMKKAMRNSEAQAIAGPVRSCVICRRRFAKGSLARHILSDGLNLTLDAGQKSPGRGWYLCADPDCVRKFARFKPKHRAQAAFHA